MSAGEGRRLNHPEGVQGVQLDEDSSASSDPPLSRRFNKKGVLQRYNAATLRRTSLVRRNYLQTL